jgi:hypothetical protein
MCPTLVPVLGVHDMQGTRTLQITLENTSEAHRFAHIGWRFCVSFRDRQLDGADKRQTAVRFEKSLNVEQREDD